ncbi:Methyl-accepting chemotaxis protein McpA [Paraliobacillus sp. PM-2]|uniref:methyl-accepting chemotaxis protein n=1 Tax=Paraliobacillus sp. PM-2 TaxID=1462524 RepID=UPI00061C3FCB|nr:methyl-accepting chemotaxis protein [Paraliobacillus sp. PM-2]CQR46518.1 Methyl-accepting chemotaxis protein McpA [Paraliobacillus sp. PM-2]
MKLRINLFFSFLLVVVLHSLVMVYTMFQLNSFSVPIIIGLSLAIILSLTIAHFTARRIVKQVSQLKNRLEMISKDNSTVLPEAYTKNKEFFQINELIDTTYEKAQQKRTFVSNVSDQIDSQSKSLDQSRDVLERDSHNITTILHEISSGSEEQANSASSLTETMQQFTNTIMNVVLNGENIKEESKSMLSITDEGTNLMHQSVEKMEVIDQTIKQSLDKVKGLDSMTEKITSLVTVIQGIAEQTNILALNAAIEAARAGEHGQSFAVVADEVRKLAEQVSHSITDITYTTNGIQEESKAAVGVLEKGYQAVNEGSSQLQTTGSTFDQLKKIITNIGTEIEDISNNLYDVLDNTKVINDSITNIASVSEESAAGIEEATTSSENLSKSVNNIRISQQELDKKISELLSHF